MQLCDAVQLIQMEYREMPDLKLTCRQAQRLWSLSPEMCQRALVSLTQARFLLLTRDGAYVRSGASPMAVTGSDARAIGGLDPKGTPS
jgi:hypothetical protein